MRGLIATREPLLTRCHLMLSTRRRTISWARSCISRSMVVITCRPLRSTSGLTRCCSCSLTKKAKWGERIWVSDMR